MLADLHDISLSILSHIHQLCYIKTEMALAFSHSPVKLLLCPNSEPVAFGEPSPEVCKGSVLHGPWKPERSTLKWDSLVYRRCPDATVPTWTHACSLTLHPLSWRKSRAAMHFQIWWFLKDPSGVAPYLRNEGGICWLLLKGVLRALREAALELGHSICLYQTNSCVKKGYMHYHSLLVLIIVHINHNKPAPCGFLLANKDITEGMWCHILL